MIVSINQPAYLPWLGYFERIALSDVHIVLDHVQFEKNSFTNRNKIRTKTGWQWLTVPVKTKGKFGALAINKLAINNDSRWTAKHWAALQCHYAKAAYFSQYGEFFETVYAQEWPLLNALLRETTTYLLSAFGIQTPVVFSSDLNVEGKKDELVLNLCKAVGATHYLSGPLGRDYLREECFTQAGIRVSYHDYQHPTYAQRYPGFEMPLAAVDLLFNYGTNSREILRA